MGRNRHEQSVFIPVRVVDGQLKAFYGSSLPKLQEGAIGELRVRAEALLDLQERMLLTAHLEIPMLPQDTELLVCISPEQGLPVVESLDCAVRPPDAEGTVVRVQLLEEQRLRLRGTKSAQLMPCRCQIPALGIEALSLNQAYTKISEHFEPHRGSHTGNAFTKTLYPVRLQDSGRMVWCYLDDLRAHTEALLEPRFGVPTRLDPSRPG